MYYYTQQVYMYCVHVPDYACLYPKVVMPLSPPIDTRPTRSPSVRTVLTIDFVVFPHVPCQPFDYLHGYLRMTDTPGLYRVRVPPLGIHHTLLHDTWIHTEPCIHSLRMNAPEPTHR